MLPLTQKLLDFWRSLLEATAALALFGALSATMSERNFGLLVAWSGVMLVSIVLCQHARQKWSRSFLIPKPPIWVLGSLATFVMFMTGICYGLMRVRN